MAENYQDLSQALATIGSSKAKRRRLQAQIDQMEDIRNRAGPEGRSGGGVYTAANPLEQIGDFMQKYGANRRLGKSGTEETVNPVTGEPMTPETIGGSGLYGEYDQAAQEGADAEAVYEMDQIRREDQKRRASVQNLGNGIIYDPETGTSRLDPNYAAAEKEKYERDLGKYDARERARQGRDTYQTVPTEGGYDVVQTNPNAQGGAGVRNHIPVQQPIPANDRQSAAENQRLAQEASDLVEELNTTDAVSPWLDVPAELARQGDLTRWMAPMIESVGYNKDELKVRNRGTALESDIIKSMSGAGVSGFEYANVQKWSPFAPGITKAQAQARLEVLNQKLLGKAEAISGANRPQQGNAGAQPQGRGASGEWGAQTTTINGRSYTKGPDGQWYEDE